MSTFLTAEWRDLVMLNYAADPALLQPLVPRGTELDFFQGQTFLSVVGFRFLHTRVLGVPIPFHRNFEEVNLRFYVRRKTGDGWRRGVVFVRELVPRFAITIVARTFYGEPYAALPMRHAIESTPAGLRIEYAWRRAGREESLRALAVGAFRPLVPDSLEAFITEHYWGYTGRASGTDEYEVVHPKWNVAACTEADIDADIVGLYGERFVESLSAPPASAFIADGSAVEVCRGVRI